MARELSETDLDDILNGSCILGGGGGGPLAIGKQLIQDMKRLGNPVRLAEVDEVDDRATMAVSAAAGAPDAVPGGAFPYGVAVQAFEGLNNLQKDASGESFSYVLPGEIGAGNTFIPLVVAAVKGIPIVDGAGARRAIPSLPMCTYAARGAPISPLVLADQQNQVSLGAKDAAAMDITMRSVIAGGSFHEFAGIACWAMSGATMKKSIIPGAITYALNLGICLRETLAAKQDPVEAVRKYLNGYLLFCGRDLTVHDTTAGGFDWGRTILQSTTSASQLCIYNQNENLIAWSSDNSKPVAMGPDLIAYLTTDGQPFSNADLGLAKGKDVAIIGAPADCELRDPAIVAAFLQTLQVIGYAGPYTPIESLQP